MTIDNLILALPAVTLLFLFLTLFYRNRFLDERLENDQLRDSLDQLINEKNKARFTSTNFAWPDQDPEFIDREHARTPLG